MMAHILWLLCFVFFVAHTTGQRTCPGSLGWIANRGRCYKFIGNPRLTYTKAVQVCSEDGATILSANDVAEHEYIRNWLQSNDARKDTWWTSGLTSKDGRVHWQGDGQQSSYTSAWVVPSTDYLVDDGRVVYKYIENEYGWAVNDPFDEFSFICEIDLDEVYRISQEPRDFDYGLNIDSPMLAPRGPRLLTEPESTVILGSTILAFFDCVASGNPEPRFEWLHEGPNGNMVPLPLDDRFSTVSGRLNIQNPVQSDENSYQCRAYNEHGSILSRPASLSFGSLGNFSPVQVGTVSAPEFQGAQLECPIITGSPGITYQWYKNTPRTFIRPENQKHTFVSSTGKLFFSELQESDGGTYYCLATLVSLGSSSNYIGSSQTESRTSVGFPLSVQKSGGNNYDPDIQKDFIFVYPSVPRRGATIKLECFAYGTGPLIYSWSRRRGGFPEGRYQFRSANRILIIRNVEMSDEDVYTCDVRSSKTKNMDTATLDLKIQADPFFIYPLTNQHADIGGSLTWHCEALGSPLPTYQWYKNGVKLPASANGIEIDSNTLTIAKLDPKHNGMYQCAASNNHGTTFSSGQLRVLEVAPSFEKSPMSKLISAARGGDVTILCDPIGAPRPTFTWSHDGTALNLQQGVYSEEDHYRMTVDGNLVIKAVTSGDSGRYTCAVQNSGGEAQDYSELRIVEGATFSQLPSSKDVEVNLTAVLVCQASHNLAERDIIYEWKFNDHVIDFERQVEYSLGVGNQEGYLYIGPAQFHNDGWYTCSIVSALDRQSESCHLQVLGPPSEPAGVRVRDDPFTEMDASETENIDPETTRWVTWIDGDDHGDTISHYFVEFRTDFDQHWRVHPDGQNIPESRTKYEKFTDTHIARLTHLKAGAGMQFRVKARNAFGIGPPSLPTSIVQIRGAKPSQLVRGVRGGGGSVGDLTINWDPVPREDFNGGGFKYLVRWRRYEDGARSDSAQWREDEILHNKACFYEHTLDSGMVFICQYVKTVGSALFYLPFEVQVAASNEHGDGPPGNTTVIMSAAELPLGAALNVYAKVFNATALMVTWTPADISRASMRGKLKGYKINYWRRDLEEESDALQTPIELAEGQDNLSEGLIIGLEPMIWYSFNVQAYNSAGNGPKSSTYSQQTLNKPPSIYPTEVHVYSVEGEGVRVNFRGISTLQREEPLLGYKVQVWKNNENIRSASEFNLGKRTNGVIRNLTTGIIYQLRVFGYSRAGQGNRSSPAIYFTVGGGEMRIDTETTAIMSSVSCITPSLVLAALAVLLAANLGSQFKLFS